MPAEHLRLDGKLYQGHYCVRCGQPIARYGSHGACTYNPDLVLKLRRLNQAGSMDEYLLRTLKGYYTK